MSELNANTCQELQQLKKMTDEGNFTLSLMKFINEMQNTKLLTC